MLSHVEQVGQLYNSWKAAKVAKTIPESAVYRPAIQNGIGPVRTIYCQDENGKRIDVIGGIEILLDSSDPKKLKWEDENLRDMIAGQQKDIEASNAGTSEPLLWLTWTECANDAICVVLGAGILWFAMHIDWRLLWHYYHGF